jgi:hypothetical protein
VSSPLRIIVTGLIAQHPSLGGVTWDYLQYAVGLARLGHDVYYFEDSGEWPYSADGGPSGNEWVATDPTVNVNYLAGVMTRFGLGGNWAYFFPTKRRWFGLSKRDRRDVIQSADLLINVSGCLHRPSDYRAIPRLAYIDSDPVFTQIKLQMPRGQLKFQKRFAAHDVFFTFGENLARPASATEPHWLPTRQPILLSEWNSTAARRETYTTVMSWTSYRPLTFRRQRYGQKDLEFKRFLELPERAAPARFEVAMSGTQHFAWESHKEKLSPRELLQATGWQVVDSLKTCGDLDSYRNYIQSSRAEWSVAKNGYIKGRSGWFSCRSACYLAAGRPVIVQDTGFRLPAGEGILRFSNLDEAAAAVREVELDYRRHAKAARAIAQEYFDSSKVLKLLVRQAMTTDRAG